VRAHSGHQGHGGKHSFFNTHGHSLETPWAKMYGVNE
jgi:hypothetical protein